MVSGDSTAIENEPGHPFVGRASGHYPARTYSPRTLPRPDNSPPFLSRDIYIANLSVRLSVRPSVRNVSVSDENGLTYRHSSPIILVLPAPTNIFTKFRRGHPLLGR